MVYTTKVSKQGVEPRRKRYGEGNIKRLDLESLSFTKKS